MPDPLTQHQLVERELTNLETREQHLQERLTDLRKAIRASVFLAWLALAMSLGSMLLALNNLARLSNQ